MSYTNSPPKYKTTFKPKTTPPFCHEWQRVSHWEVVISSSLEELASSSSSSLTSPSSFVKAYGEGDGEIAKPPRRASRRAMHLMQVFTWHISLVRESRRASMHWSCAMMAFKVTSTAKEGAEVEGAEKEGGVAKEAEASIFVCGRFCRIAPPNRTNANGTYKGEIRRFKNGDGEVAKDPCDSWRKDKLITSRRILIHIKDRCNEVRRKVYREVLKRR